MTALHRRPLLSALCVPALLAASVAHAQDGDSARLLDGVTVVAERASTATKTDTPLTETPQAISVVGAGLFSDRGAQTLQETLRYTAGVTAEAYGLDSRADGSSIRGLGPVEYQDGLRRLFGFSPIARQEVYGLERVEVLRGPSSVLYGAGTTGGIINSMSKRPSQDAGGEIGVQLGTFDRRQLQGDITGALNDAGTVAGRFVGVVREAGSQTDHVDDDRIYLAPSVSWYGQDSTLTVLASYQRDQGASTQQFLPVVATLHAPAGRRLDPGTFLGDPDFDTLDTRMASVTALFEHRFNDTVKLRSALRYIDSKTEFRELFPNVYGNPANPFIDADQRLLDRTAYGVKPDNQILSSDNALEFTFATGAFQHLLLTGVDYSDFREASFTLDATATPIDIYNPVSAGVTINAWNRLPDQRSTQLGVYVQDQIRWADRVSLVLGARRDHARSKTEGSPASTDNATTYRIGLIGDVGAGVSPYVSYSESFLPVPGQDNYGKAFVPMRGRQVEGGLKWQPHRNALFTVAGYRITETNRQTNDPNDVLNVVQTGEIESKGVELEGAYAFDMGLNITAAYARSEAKVTRSNYAPEVGLPLNDTPQELASLWLSQQFTLDADSSLRVGLGGRHVGSTVSDGPGGFLRTPGYTLIDALLQVDVTAWSMGLNINNLAGKKYFAPCRNFGDCFTGAPRTVVGTIRYRF